MFFQKNRLLRKGVLKTEFFRLIKIVVAKRRKKEKKFGAFADTRGYKKFSERKGGILFEKKGAFCPRKKIWGNGVLHLVMLPNKGARVLSGKNHGKKNL